MKGFGRVIAVVLTAAVCTVAHAQAAPNQAQIMEKLQRLMGGKDSKAVMARVTVIGAVLTCTQNSAGKDATNAFYQQLRAVGDQARGDCRAGQPEHARQRMLEYFTQNKNHPVMKAALGCYDSMVPEIQALGDPQVSTDAANVSRWVRDPALAAQEMKANEVCQGSNSQAALQ